MNEQENNLTTEPINQNGSTTTPSPAGGQSIGGQTIIINQSQPESKRNGMGVAGFVLALLGLLLSWVPVLGWILWVLGLIFSFIGVFKAPRGLSITGLVISCLSLILLILLASLLAAAFSAFS